MSLLSRIRRIVHLVVNLVLSFFGSVTHWFDRLLQGARQQPLDDEEPSPGPKSVFSKLWAGLTWLPRRIGAASEATERQLRRAKEKGGAIGERLTEADSSLVRILKKILTPFASVGFLLSRFFNPIFDRIRELPVIGKAFSILKLAVHPFVAIAVFISSFIGTRSYVTRFWGAGLLCLLMLAAGFYWFSGFRGRNIPKAYRTAFEKAISQGDFKNAQLYQQKLMSLGVTTSQSQVQSIIDLANSGKMTEAIQLAEELAPLEGFGSPEAHLWLSYIYLNEKDPSKTKTQNLELLDVHLKKLTDFFQAEKRMAMPPNISFLKALVELRKNNFDEGLRILESLSNFWPAVAYLVEANSLLDREAATSYSRLLLQMVRSNKKILDELDESFFPVWSRALITQDESTELNEVLGYWHQKFPQNSNARVEWSLVQFQQLESLIERGSSAQISEASSLLVEIARRLGKENYSVLSDWIIPRFPPIGKNTGYLDLAKSVENEPGLTSELAEILGTSALIRNDAEKGVELLKKATLLDPKNAIAWNNLAHAIDSSPELDRSLSPIDLVEKAIRLAPNRSSFRHTRGMIHLKKENWDSAIEDLNLFLRDEPNNRDAHAAVGKAYRAKGDSKLADIHEELSKQ